MNRSVGSSTCSLPQAIGGCSLQWRHYGHDSVSNHQPRDCLLNRLFRRRSKKTSKPRVTGLCVGNSPGPVNSPHKRSLTRKMFPFDDVIMWIKACSKTYGMNRPVCLDAHNYLLTRLFWRLILLSYFQHPTDLVVSILHKIYSTPTILMVYIPISPSSNDFQLVQYNSLCPRYTMQQFTSRTGSLRVSIYILDAVMFLVRIKKCLGA